MNIWWQFNLANQLFLGDWWILYWWSYCILHSLYNKKDNLAEFNLADFHNSSNHQNKFYTKFSSYTVFYWYNTVTPQGSHVVKDSSLNTFYSKTSNLYNLALAFLNRFSMTHFITKAMLITIINLVSEELLHKLTKND